ncbi:MAG: S8 family peptidase [bacterium]
MSGLPKKLKIALYLSFLLVYASSAYALSLKVHPFLSEKLSLAKENEFIPIIIRLSDDDAASNIYGIRSKALISIRNKSNKINNTVSELLKDLRNKKLIRNERYFWLCEALYVEVKKEAFDDICLFPQIKRITPNYTLSLPETSDMDIKNISDSPNWGLDGIDVKKVWKNFGLTGKGVKIGHLDTGIDKYHPYLQDKLDKWAAFNIQGQRIKDAPVADSETHGTHTAGILVGGNTVDELMGVAPDAKLISARVIDGKSGSFAQLLAGMEWIVDPDNDPNTDDGADIVNISLGVSGLYDEFVEPIYNLICAGITPVVAIGNSGIYNTNSPANIPYAIGCGAIDYYDQVCSFSGGDEIVWNHPLCKGSCVKPDFTAPGYRIVSASSDGGFITLSGTSMATPFVSGLIALMLEHTQTLNISQIKEILKYSSVDLGVDGKDNRYGWGKIDAYAACRCLMNGTYLDFESNGWESGNWVYISTPQEDESIWGEAVSIIAVAGHMVKKVIFEYSIDADDWNVIDVCSSNPFSTYWGVESLSSGKYYLRAKAVCDSGVEVYSREIITHVDRDNPVITESGLCEVNPLLYHKKAKRILPDNEEIIATAEGTAVIVPRNLFNQEKVIEITNIESARLNEVIPPHQSNLQPIGIYREISFTDGTDIFERDITIILPYIDADSNGVVDNTSICSNDLAIYYLKESNGKPIEWVEVESVKSSNYLSPNAKIQSKNTLSAKVKHLTLFAVFGNIIPQSLSSVVVYPNPVYDSPFIYFDGLSMSSRIKIFDTLGHIIKDSDVLETTKYKWYLLDNDNITVSNGIYFYLIKDSMGNKTTGKFAVIR